MVRGSTVEERQQARAKRTCANRADMYVHLMEAARWQEQSPRKTLGHACDFLRAAARSLPDEEVYELAEQVTKMADERNKP